jgi:prepilin-type N-terminal cleavage/methylation domain-containing protein
LFPKIIFCFGQQSPEIRKSKFRATTGFTLLEVLVAMAILSITLVALSRSQSQSISVTGESRAMTTL